MRAKALADLFANILGYVSIAIVVLSLVGIMITGTTAAWLWAFNSELTGVWGRFLAAFVVSLIGAIIAILLAVMVDSVGNG